MTYHLVLTTVSSLSEARRLADLLLKQKLAACVTLSRNLESHYWWKGKMEKNKEVLLFIKTKAAIFKRLEKTIRANHSYSVPEIVAIPIQKGSQKYLNWISKEVR